MERRLVLRSIEPGSYPTQIPGTKRLRMLM
jgi:hypothetical protein